eukprot:CAMPEP_0202732700 /NCGR_PEP_ID=MMETSP1385-20130828/187792_1 /ASSEMBLY_ACC=CAM_ASM_000861 /TAXON_ID=933848 /ORGANISM="Elphidium margaritaceum" /LENGTH=916 /DNA_ID=CAMNT_0049399023 /DNA_START=29 /DNA_END=2779 /DNA_ORIENTATION=-
MASASEETDLKENDAENPTLTMTTHSYEPSKLDLFYSRSQCYVSAFFIISPRGSTILSKDFRSDLPSRKCIELFWQNIKSEEQQFETCTTLQSRDVNQNGNDAPSSFFNIQNISYIYHKNIHNIYYVVITKCNISPSFAIESLHKLRQSFCDYCGRRSMTEQAIQDNFILLYELVDEFYDNGYIQIPSVNDLLNLNVIYNQPTLDNLSEIWNLLLTADLIATHTDSSRHRSHNTAISSFAPPPHPTTTVIESPDKNQIFVDIVEYINVTSQSFYYRRNHISLHSSYTTHQQHQPHQSQQPNNYLQLNHVPIVQNSSIHGIITMKVFLFNDTSNDGKTKNGKTKTKKKKKKKKRKKSKMKLKFGKNKNNNNNASAHEKDNVEDGEDDDDDDDDCKHNAPVLTAQEKLLQYLQSLPPGIRLQFNDDLVVGRENAPPYNKIFGALILDDVSFHKKIIASQYGYEDIVARRHELLNAAANKPNTKKTSHPSSFIDNFAKKKILKFFLPNGEEFDIMNYRITSSFRDGIRSRPASCRGSPRVESAFKWNGQNKQQQQQAPSPPTPQQLQLPASSSNKSEETHCDHIRIPYRIVPIFNVVRDANQTVPVIEFYLKIRAEYPVQSVGRDVIVEFNVPNCVSTVTLHTRVGHRPQQQLGDGGGGSKKEKGKPAPNRPGSGSGGGGSAYNPYAPHQHHEQNGHNGVYDGADFSARDSGKKGSAVSDKDLATVRQSAECITIGKNAHAFSRAFNIDLNAKYSIHSDEWHDAHHIHIGKTRQLNPERCYRKVVWTLNKFPSGVEHVLRCKFTLNYHHELTHRLLMDPCPNNGNDDDDDDRKQQQPRSPSSKQKEFDLYKFRKLVSPIAMKFQIDNYNVSGLDIRSLRCIDWLSQRDDGGSNNGVYTTYRPYRWVRRITKSGSYICRL